MLNAPTLEQLHALKLGAMAAAWTAHQPQADVTALTFDERFALLVEAEWHARENKRLTRALQEAKLKLARIGADYLVFRGGKAVVGPLVLGSAELRDLRASAPIAVYSSAKRELGQRVDGFPEAVALVDAILDLRLSA